VEAILHHQARLTQVRCIAKISMMLVFTLLFISKSLHAEPPAADTSKVIVTEEYFKTPEKKSALFDSSGRQLNTQQMVDFLKNELRKLNQQITSLLLKAAPDSSSSTTADDVDVMKLFIIKGKLESMEKTLDEWTKQREEEITSQKTAPSSNSPHGKQ